VVGPFIQFVGNDKTLQIAGIRFVGVNLVNGRKLFLTAIFLGILWLIGRGLRFVARKTGGERQTTAFWTRQGINIVLFVSGILGILSIWFDNPARLATGASLVAAGLAFAMQKVVTSFAGYFVILRGKTFNVGDRITMGGVRGDVIALNFLQTVVMEMGEPGATQEDGADVWVQSRQYTGRIVTISNAEIFEKPVYNYTRDFPYIWEEMHLPISYRDDRRRAEEIILEAVRKHTTNMADLAEPELERITRQFFIERAEIAPRVYVRLTDNWIELSVRFLCKTHSIRRLKDQISREIIDGLEAAGIGIASSTYDIVGFPPVQVQMAAPPAATQASTPQGQGKSGQPAASS
jgi:small-conductance mechanosensitive channel